MALDSYTGYFQSYFFSTKIQGECKRHRLAVLFSKAKEERQADEPECFQLPSLRTLTQMMLGSSGLFIWQSVRREHAGAIWVLGFPLYHLRLSMFTKKSYASQIPSRNAWCARHPHYYLEVC